MFTRIGLYLATAALLLGALSVPANAAPSSRLLQIQAKVNFLREAAASAAEGAQEAKIKLSQLNQELDGVQKKAASQKRELIAIQKSLGAIAVDQYINGGYSASLQLLFAADPKAYLASAGDLDSLTRRKSVELRRFSAASQKLQQTTLVVTDRVQLVRATQAKFVRQAQAAQKNLADAEIILKSLKASERKALLAAQKRAEANDYANSKNAAKSYRGVSGRAGKAIKYALAQIGDRYVFGADGMRTWDCSGLTMRAYQAAGVSLPHSSRAQFRYGRHISRSNLQPGDLIFFKSPISHVGIYLGGGRMVHAPRPGSRVKIAPINQMRFAGAVRL
jgi:cell wall-associated NlpC family hydrolase